MSFSAEWLALREPFDLRARHRGVLRQAAAALAGRPAVTIVDLACGTGATLRALGPHLAMHQSWRLFDNDLSLLAKVPPAANVQVHPLDLVCDLEAALDGPVDLVTTSALLDLVSVSWLERLVTEVAARQTPLYAALSYDGRVDFTPEDPRDAAVIAAVNLHQRGDKGFGPALGPLGRPDCRRVPAKGRLRGRIGSGRLAAGRGRSGDAGGDAARLGCSRERHGRNFT